MYESFYNFAEPPFRLTPDPRFYFSSATHKRALTHLRFGFHQREGFVVITGKPGTGKTELMLHLLEGLPQDRVTYGKIVTSNLDPNEMLQQVAAAFNIPAQGIKKGVLLKKLEDVFLQHVRENKRLVLIVDEAHKLTTGSLNELQMLTNFQLSGRAALQCFLSGHDSLKVTLQNPELLHLKQRVITSTFLTPLERHETSQYIEHRLRCVGWEGDPKFNQTAYSLIHDTTEGIPRQINALCNRVLLRAYAEQKHYIDESMVLRAIDDVQAEPLASNLVYHKVAAHATGVEFYQAPREFAPGAFSHAVETEPAVHHSDADDGFMHAYNDLDETLPLPPEQAAANETKPQDSTWSATAYSNVSPQADIWQPTKDDKSARQTTARMDDISEDTLPVDGDLEIINEAHAFSDALSKFHQQSDSTSKMPARASVERLPVAQESFVYDDENTIIRRKRHSQAPRYLLATTALLVLGVGMFYWAFPKLNPINPQKASTVDEEFSTAIKGVFSGQSQPDGNIEAEPKAQQKPAEVLIAAVPEAMSGTQAVASEEGQSLNSDTGEELIAREVTVAKGAVEDETWSSGALGGDFLKQADEPPAAVEVVVAVAEPEAEMAEPIQTAPEPAAQGPSSTPGKKEQIAENATQPPSNTDKKIQAAAVVAVPAAVATETPLSAATASKPSTKSSSKPKSQTSAKPAQKPTTTRTEGEKPASAATTAGAVDQVASAPPSPAVVMDSEPEQTTNMAAKADVSIDQVQLDQLLTKLTSAYEKGNLNQLLSVLSKDVRSNDGTTRRDMKNGYRKLFNITDMRKMTISSVNWSREDRLIRGEGEFELFVREKGADKVTSYGGIINLEVADGADGAVITKLTYDYKN